MRFTYTLGATSRGFTLIELIVIRRRCEMGMRFTYIFGTKSWGFTLIELIVATAILTILTRGLSFS